MSYEKIVEWCVVKIDRPLYSRIIAAPLWDFAEARVQHVGHPMSRMHVVQAKAPFDAAPTGVMLL
jgi:hypothetical protein